MSGGWLDEVKQEAGGPAPRSEQCLWEICGPNSTLSVSLDVGAREASRLNTELVLLPLTETVYERRQHQPNGYTTSAFWVYCSVLAILGYVIILPLCFVREVWWANGALSHICPCHLP